jgi:choline-sulfatase
MRRWGDAMSTTAQQGKSPAGSRRTAKAVVIVVGLVVLIATGVYVGMRGRGAGSGGASGGGQAATLSALLDPGQARGMNLLLVTLDTTRPDHLGCYGYASAKTPTIDGLCARGVRFDDAVTSVPITLPSHTVMMTGKYPPHTGVRANGSDRVGEDEFTLAETFKGAGYATGAFVSAFVLDDRFGLDQGFDEYDFQVGDHMPRRTMALHNERRADAVTREALRWLEDRNPSEPFFLWVHYFDPHAPYDSPLANLDRFRGRPYDAEIAYVDMQLKRLLAAVERQGLTERTLIVLTTDHGEALFEHGEAYHSVFIYESTLRAALIFSNPVLFDGAYRVSDHLVGLVDIYPTLVDLFALDAQDAACDGINLTRQDPDPKRTIYIETVYPQVHMACGPLFGVRRHHDKYIRAPQAEYYDLARDPDERENRYDSGAAGIAELSTQLDAYQHEWADLDTRSQLVELNEEDLQRLAALGYAAGAADGLTGDEPCDPKEHIEIINGMTVLAQHIAKGDREEAVRVANELIAAADGWADPVRRLANLYAEEDRWDKVAEVLEKFTKQHPEPEMVLRLATAYDRLGRDRLCAQTLEVAERLEPDLGAIYILRGDRALARGDRDAALRAFRTALERDAERIGPEARPRIAALLRDSQAESE